LPAVNNIHSSVAIGSQCVQMHVGSHEIVRYFGGLPAFSCRVSALASADAAMATPPAAVHALALA